MTFFEAGESVHAKWRAALDEAKREMGLMHPSSRPVKVSGRVDRRKVFIHDNDNIDVASIAVAKRDVAS